MLALADGTLYVSDRGRDGVWQFTPSSNGWRLFWLAPEVSEVERYAPSGLAYNATTQTLIISESYSNSVYRVSLDGATTAACTAPMGSATRRFGRFDCRAGWHDLCGGAGVAIAARR